MALLGYAQRRDMSGLGSNYFGGLSFTGVNQYFTLTEGDVTSVTVPAGNDTLIAIFTYTLGVDVWVLPSDSPTLTAPNGTVKTYRYGKVFTHAQVSNPLGPF